jgi:hypothetical protein
LGGWGFNCVDKEYCIGGEIPIAYSEANYLDENILKAKPFFRKGSDSDLYEPGNIGSTYAANNMNRLLADAMPALTLPAGANHVEIFTNNNLNFDMQDKSFKKKNQDWPANRGLDIKWRHSDIREIAYPYIFNLFDKFITQGGLNQ